MEGITCVVCDCGIKHPKIGQIVCSKESCCDEFVQNEFDVWCMKNQHLLESIDKKTIENIKNKIRKSII